MIKRALAGRHSRDSFFTEVKNGPTHTATELLIMDAVAFKRSWANPCIMGYEIKVSRSDFLGDEKWRGYLPYCNRLSFVCPRGLIKADELPEEVGLIYYNQEKDSLYTRRKAAYREIEPPVGMMMYLIMRWGAQEHPFFSSNREYFEALMQDKVDRKNLGHYVAKETKAHIKELEGKIRDFEHRSWQYDTDMEMVEELRQLVEPYLEGAWRSKWDVINAVKKVLKTGLPPDVAGHVLTIDRELEELKKLTKVGGQ